MKEKYESKTLREELSQIQKGKIFYKGFYDDFFSFKREIDEFEDSFYFMENICDAFEDEDDLQMVNLWKYIHGYCDEFAMLLCKLYGYEIKMAFKRDSLIHAWCQKGEYFIDARGITNDEKLFFSEYDMKGTEIFTLKDLDEFFQFATDKLAEVDATFCVECKEELDKLETDSYMKYYYQI